MSARTYMDAAFLRRLEGMHLMAKRLADRAPAGAHLSHALGDGLEFADHRAYAPGDDVRFIDWPYYARMEKLLVRLFHRHSESDVAVLLDTSASMAAGETGKFDHARRIAAALAYVAVGGGRRVLVQPFAESLGPTLRSARDRAKILPMLNALGRLVPQGTTALGACARDFAQRAKNVGTVLLLSDLLDASDELDDALAWWNPSRRDVIVLHAYAATDAAPGLAGTAQLQHAESDASLPMNITPAIRTAYADAWADYRADIEHTCQARQTIYVPMPTDTPIEKLLLQTLTRAGVLRV